ncbi:MAG: hypothetical protein ISS69_15350 [Phycisphaerae bacterium]|nr:hypothetical protein [Phycisphaerae bacterium]
MDIGPFTGENRHRRRGNQPLVRKHILTGMSIRGTSMSTPTGKPATVPSCPDDVFDRDRDWRFVQAHGDLTRQGKTL